MTSTPLSGSVLACVKTLLEGKILDKEDEYRAIMVKVFELAERLTGGTNWLTDETESEVMAIAARVAANLGVDVDSVNIE
jgi:HD superfamily phosphodiesterase